MGLVTTPHTWLKDPTCFHGFVTVGDREGLSPFEDSFPGWLATLVSPLTANRQEGKGHCARRREGSAEMNPREEKAQDNEWNYGASLRFERSYRALKPAVIETPVPEAENALSFPSENGNPFGREESKIDRDARGSNAHEQVAALYKDYYPKIYRYLQSLRLDAEEIEELIQEVFLLFMIQLFEGHEIKRPQGWVIRVAHNLAVKLQQKKAKRQQKAAAEERALALDRPDPAPNQELNYLEEERVRRLREALAGFKLRDQQCFIMRLQGMSFRDIGKAMNISERRAGVIVDKVAMRLAVLCE